jgi:two-component system, response regulator
MKGKTILLVEDDRDDLELTLRAFQRSPSGLEVIVVRDGLEALDFLFGTGCYADKTPEPPALVLLDLNLPKLNGLEVLRRIKINERTRTIPVAVLTSSEWDLLSAESLRLGAEACLVKPVDRGAVDQLAAKLSIPGLE